MTELHLPPPPVPATPWALFLDVDGTLLELAGRPDAVVVPPALPALLDALAAALGGALALVSGRALADVDRLFAPHRYALAGSHGAEWRLPGSTVVQHLALPALDAAAERLAAFVEAHPGTLMERKSHGLALHWRNAPAAEDGARACMAALHAGLGEAFRLLDGKAVLELLPAGIDKGAAVGRFCAAAPFAGRVPVFVGDDVTDEAGFAAVNARGGFAVHVGSAGRSSAATHRLPTPAAVGVWLTRDVLPACHPPHGAPT